MYRPITWDIILLGDANLFAEIEKDFTAYGMNWFLEVVKLLEKEWASHLGTTQLIHWIRL